VLVEVVLDLLVSNIDAQLFKRIPWKIFKPKNVNTESLHPVLLNINFKGLYIESHLCASIKARRFHHKMIYLNGNVNR